jgi:hypothetical protein
MPAQHIVLMQPPPPQPQQGTVFVIGPHGQFVPVGPPPVPAPQLIPMQAIPQHLVAPGGLPPVSPAHPGWAQPQQQQLAPRPMQVIRGQGVCNKTVRERLSTRTAEGGYDLWCCAQAGARTQAAAPLTRLLLLLPCPVCCLCPNVHMHSHTLTAPLSNSSSSPGARQRTRPCRRRSCQPARTTAPARSTCLCPGRVCAAGLMRSRPPTLQRPWTLFCRA